MSDLVKQALDEAKRVAVEYRELEQRNTELNAALQATMGELDLFKRRLVTSEELRTNLHNALQSATERLSCGHWKGDWVEASGSGYAIVKNGELELNKSYCRTCAEIHLAELTGEHRAYAAVERHVLGTEPLLPEGQHTGVVIDRVLLERTAAAMAQQREADAKKADDEAAVPNAGGGTLQRTDACVNVANAIRNFPLAPLAQEWLEKHDAEVYNEAQDDTAKSYEAKLYGMVTPEELTQQLHAEFLKGKANGVDAAIANIEAVDDASA